MKILNFGSLNLDYIFKVDHFVMPGETLSADSMAVFPGGKGLNQSIALARAGACVFHGGCYGEGGESLVSLLKENNADTSLIERTNCPQGCAMISVTPNGQNSIVISGGSNLCIKEEQTDAALSHFSAGDWLLMQNEINDPRWLIDKAYEKGMKIILNPSPFNERLKEADFNKLTWLIVNETEAFQITGSREPETVWQLLHEQYPSLSLVLTLGEEGSYGWQCEGEKVVSAYQKAYQVDAVDTTGAGDTFTGYFVHSLMEGMALESCMKRAAAAAALCVMKPSAASSVPFSHETDRFLKEQGEAL